jgi:hypothetical protein
MIKLFVVLFSSILIISCASKMEAPSAASESKVRAPNVAVTGTDDEVNNCVGVITEKTGNASKSVAACSIVGKELYPYECLVWTLDYYQSKDPEYIANYCHLVRNNKAFECIKKEGSKNVAIPESVQLCGLTSQEKY